MEPMLCVFIRSSKKFQVPSSKFLVPVPEFNLKFLIFIEGLNGLI